MLILDDLIKICYGALKKSLNENAKIGDLLKMIELRHKLAPGDSSRRELLDMLEKIRKEELPQDKNGNRRKPKPRKTRSTKK